MPADRSLTRRVLGRTAALAAMALLIVGMASMKDGPDTRDVPTLAPQLVAVVDGDVVIVDSNDGDVVRAIAEGEPGRTDDVVVSPDGRYVYFTRLGNSDCAAGEIVRVPLSDDGDEEVVARGSNPTISPDGRTLAYSEPGPADVCPPIPQLLLRDLASGDEYRWQEWLDDTGQVRDYTPPSAIEPIAWAPDARVLAIHVELGPAPSQSAAVDTHIRSDFLSADLAPLPLAPEMRLLAYRSDGQLVVIDRQAIVLVDPITGEAERTMIDAGAPITDAWSDGKRVAFTARGSRDLHVWQPSDEKFRIVPVSVESAAWLP